MIQMLNKEYEIRNLKAVQARIKEIEVDYTEDFIRLHREIITTLEAETRGDNYNSKYRELHSIEGNV